MDKSMKGTVRQIEVNTRNTGSSLPQTNQTPTNISRHYELLDRDVVVFGYDSETNTGYGYDNDHVYQTTDDWTTKDIIFDSPTGQVFHTNAYQGASRILKNGRLLVTASEGDGGTIYLSNEERTDFEPVLNCEAGLPRSGWGLADHGNIIIVGEYGSQSRKAHISFNGGLSFRVLYDRPEETIDTNYSCHIHSVGYDPYRGTCWITWGDNVNRLQIYSHDFGKTWHELYDGMPPIDPIGILATPDGVLFGSDTLPDGIDLLPINTIDIEIDTSGIKRVWNARQDYGTAIYALIASAIEIDGVYYFATLFSAVREHASIVASIDGHNFFEVMNIPLDVVSAPSGIMNVFDAGEDIRACVKTEINGGFKELRFPKPKFT